MSQTSQTLRFDESVEWPVPPTVSKVAMVAGSSQAIGGSDTRSDSKTRSWFKARPSMLHFGGFVVGQEYHLNVDIVNVMHESKRMQVLPPSTPNFKISFDKKGHIAPGLAQSVRVTFLPTEYRYYYDCLRVQDEVGILPIAIHGYPTANTVDVPTRVDFGTCALTETHRRTFSIACSIPMPFAFRFEVVRSHPHIELSPLQGTIPANASLTVHVAYTPLTLGTASMEVDLFVEQFAFEPKRIVICGNSASGIVRQRLIEEVSQSIEQLRSTRQQQEAESGLLANDKDILGSPQRPRGVGSGAVVDGGTTWIREKHARASKKMGLQTEKSNAQGKTFTEKMKAALAAQTRGVDLPDHFHTQAGVNAILTQVPGKMKTKDLKATSRTALQKSTAFTKSTTFAPPPRELDLEQILLEESMETRQQPFQLRELTFCQECNNIREYEKSKLLRANEEFVGSKLLSADDLEVIRQNRQQLAKDEREARWELDKRRTETVYKGVDEADELCARPTTYVSSVRLEDIVAGSAAPTAIDIQATLTFDPNTNDEWRKRMNIQRRFIAAVSKVVVRMRVARRLLRIRAWLGDCNDKAEIRKRIEEDNRIAATGGNSAASNADTPVVAQHAAVRGGKHAAATAEEQPISALELSTAAPAFRLQEETRAKLAVQQPFELTPEMFKQTTLPRYVPTEEDMQPPKPFSMELVKFDDRTTLPLVEQAHVDAMGYQLQSYATIPFYFPPDPARQPVEGGFEESCLREPAGDSLEDLLELLEGDLPSNSNDTDPEDPTIKYNGKYLLSRQLQQGRDLENAPIPAALLSDENNFSLEERYLNRVTPYYLPPVDLKETDPDWRVKTTPLDWQPDETIAAARLAEPGYLAVASYMDMPTISDVYLPDTDRHASGLNCYANDHLRLPSEPDPDLAPIERGVVDKEDILTDSESDDEDAYPTVRPSVARNRNMWRQKDRSAGNKKEEEEEAAATSNDPAALEISLQAMRDQAMSIDKRKEVVELSRQKVLLAQARELTEQRKKQFSMLPDRLAAISRAAPALHLAMPVQMPFHTVEDKLFKKMKQEKEREQQLHRQQGPRNPEADDQG